MTTPVDNPPTQPTVEEVVACLNQIAPGQVVVAREWLTIQDAIALLSALEQKIDAMRGVLLVAREILEPGQVHPASPRMLAEIDTAIDLARGQL